MISLLRQILKMMNIINTIFANQLLKLPAQMKDGKQPMLIVTLLSGLIFLIILQVKNKKMKVLLLNAEASNIPPTSFK